MIILTGGAGFIGSCILSRLNQRGQKNILVVDHIEDDPRKKRNLENKRFQDYEEKDAFLKRVKGGSLPDGVTAVIHMGACSATTGTDARYYQENNYEYTRHLAEWALARGVRFIYASSAATYGDGEQGYNDDPALLPALRPLNLYGDSKHRFDLWVLEQHLEDRVAGLKFFNVFGPNEYHKGDMRSVVAKAYARAAGEGIISLFKSYRPDYADGEQKRDFIYVKDAVDVVLYFLDHPETGGIYNVGTGTARSWNDLARALFAAVGKEPRLDYMDMPETLRERYQYFTQADMRRLRAAGYHRPFTSLEDAVKDYAGYLENQSYF